MGDKYMLNALQNIFIKDTNNFTFRPSKVSIKEKGWYCRIYLEYYDAIEASFIANAVKKIDSKNIEFFIKPNDNDDIDIVLCGENNDITVEYVDSFYSKTTDINIHHSGFTNENIDYLYFKDAENNFFMLFGSEEFIHESMPIDPTVYEYYYKNYYGNWSSDLVDKLLIRMWDEYPR